MDTFWRWQCANSYFLALAMCQLRMCTPMYGIIQNPTLYTCSPCLLAEDHFTFSLKFIISFLVQLQHLLLPYLIVTSSQVRVNMPLPLQLCCISGLGPEGLLHNRTIPGSLPTQGDPCIQGKLCLQEPPTRNSMTEVLSIRDPLCRSTRQRNR